MRIAMSGYVLVVFGLVAICEAQPVTKEQIDSFLSQFKRGNVAVKERPYSFPEGPQLFGDMVKVKYYGDNGKIKSIAATKHPITLPIETAIQDAAEKFLRDHAEHIGIKSDLSDVLLARPPISSYSQYGYNQYYQGYPVHHGRLVIAFNSDNQLASFDSYLVPITDPRPIPFAIDREAALQRVFEKFCMLPECNEENTRHIKTEQFVRVIDGVPYGTWEISVGAFKGLPSWVWIVWIDGETGEVISAREAPIARD